MRSNIAVAAVLLALAGYIFLAAGTLPFGTMRVPQTAFFPKTLAVLLGIMSVILLARTLAGKEAVSGGEKIETQGWIRIAVTLMTLAGFALALERLGFLLTTFLLMISLLRAIEAQKWRKVVVVALATALISYAIFSLLLGVPLPAGLLGI
ncbi:MAG TPA: tripartite tricarboxylate transporter TctB family protein [Verrucomicrobiae bacterium]|jgi:putative tricarboxylic transport membrane protein|nr:tripartite tricarboxylate transporter TctB family protein [Verrucomicrobiae bacterium]